MEKITHSAEETIEFAKEIGSRLKKGDIVAYTGVLVRVKQHLPVDLPWVLEWTIM